MFGIRFLVVVSALAIAGPAFAGGDSVSLFDQKFEGTLYTGNQSQFNTPQYQNQWKNDQANYNQPWTYQNRWDLDQRRYPEHTQAAQRKYQATDEMYHEVLQGMQQRIRQYEERARQYERRGQRQQAAQARHQASQLRVMIQDGQRVHEQFHHYNERGSGWYQDPRCIQSQVAWMQRYGNVQDSWYDMNGCTTQTNPYGNQWTPPRPKPQWPNADWSTQQYGLPEPDFFDMLNGQATLPPVQDPWYNQSTPWYNNDCFGTGQYGYEQWRQSYQRVEIPTNQGNCQTWNDQYYRPPVAYQQPTYQPPVYQPPVYQPQPQVVYQPQPQVVYPQPQVVYPQPQVYGPAYRQPRVVNSAGIQQHTMNIVDGVFHIASGAQEHDDKEVFGGVLSTFGNILILSDILD